MADVISRFVGKNFFLDNFFPCKVIYEGRWYPSVEHAFQAAKTFDPQQRETIAISPTAQEAKARGRRVELRADWEEIKDQVMHDCVKSKFTTYPRLRERLLATGDAELIEGNEHGDRYWGVYRGEGKNMLGKTLMRVREELRKADGNE